MTDDAREADHLGEELSAWVDGEAEDAALVESHVAGCPECAARYRELNALSAALRSLPGPVVGEDFAERVAARIGRGASARRYWPAAAALLAAAAGVVIVAAVVLSVRQPGPMLRTTGVEDVPPGGESGLFDEMLLSSDAAAWDYGFPASGDTPEMNAEELVLALSASGWFEDAAEAWEAERDIEELVQSLDETEKMEFERLLRTYEEGAEI